MGVLCVLEGRSNSKDEMSMIRQWVVTRVEGRHRAGTVEKRLPL